jgi:hypothetical protein
MIPCRHMLFFAFFLMMSLILSKGVGIYFIPSPTLCRRATVRRVADIQILRFATLDTAMIRFYFSILFSNPVSSVWSRFDAQDVDTPFQSPDLCRVCPLCISFFLIYLVQRFDCSYHLYVTLISLLLFYCCVGAHIHGLWIFLIQTVTRDGVINQHI